MASDETRDALTRLPDDVPIAMAGYSFGAGIATQILDDRITRWVLVAPPLTPWRLDLDAIASDPRPKHLLAPVHDQFCPPSDTRAATDRWAATTVEPIEGADHFLAGATTRVAARTLELIGARRARVRLRGVRVLLVSDLHYDLRKLDWVLSRAGDPASGIDVVVVAGDLLDIASSVPLDTQITVALSYLERLAARVPDARLLRQPRPRPPHRVGREGHPLARPRPEPTASTSTATRSTWTAGG